MNKKQQQFVEVVWQHYKQAGRHTLPWRQATDPYAILVSEIMLQQTQVDRVIPKYQVFLKKWPTVHKLARATLGDVLIVWQGLGYNRRAKHLHLCAQSIVRDYKGVFPTDYRELQTLPAIGPYTAGAIMAFAYNTPVALIETNIRTVYLHHFFSGVTDVSDTDILVLVEKTLDTDRARDWYAALMDYGSYLKKTQGNNTKQSKHFTKQSPFAGSDRQIRGAIIKALGTKAMSLSSLVTTMSVYEKERVIQQINALITEGLVQKNKSQYQLPI